MKKTDLAKNQGLALAHKLKNSAGNGQVGRNKNSIDKKALALAGTMGGEFSEITAGTTKISLELTTIYILIIKNINYKEKSKV